MGWIKKWLVLIVTTNFTISEKGCPATMTVSEMNRWKLIPPEVRHIEEDSPCCKNVQQSVTIDVLEYPPVVGIVLIVP